ncbi:MAG: N-acetylmuramoyl-L-alanine amidase [Elusimicrobiota bacterium]
MSRSLFAAPAVLLVLLTIHCSLFTPSAVHAESLPVPLPDTPTDDVISVEISSPTVPVSTAALATPSSLRIVYPPEGARMQPLRTSFVYGSADPKGQLTVNGQSVSIFPGGGFLAMIPFSTGTFQIRAELALGGSKASAVRTVSVADFPRTSPASPPVMEYVKPDVDADLRTGDVVTVLCKGSPGLDASFEIEGARGRFPLIESRGSQVGGIYRGSYVVQARDKLEKSKLTVTLLDRPRGEKAVREAPGRLNRWPEESAVVVEVSGDNAVLRAGPQLSAQDKLGYIMFPPAGTRMAAVGRLGDEVKVRLSAGFDAWIGEKEVRRLPAGTPAPRTVVGGINVSSDPRRTRVRAPMGQKVPFEVNAWPGGPVDVRFFGAVSNTDWMHYDSSGGVVSQIQWFQDTEDVYRLRVHAPADSWWGYDARYEGTTFVLELRNPPPPSPRGRDGRAPSPLQDLVVAVDAGHSSDNGSVGPTGLVEKDANLAIAKCLQKKLQAEGARVTMIREGGEHVALYERPKLAWQSEADLLVSVHNNALPDGANPFERTGYGVYYFHPHSFALARDIHASYGETFAPRRSGEPPALRDDGLHYGNLALPRTPQMPAVLVESAYIIYPPEESLLKTEAFQCRCADAILGGLRDYARRMRRIQAELDRPAWRAP